jgi:predicted RNase H-like nuclease (RuvC/YqgF family)
MSKVFSRPSSSLGAPICIPKPELGNEEKRGFGNGKKLIKNYRHNRDKTGARFVAMQTQAQA